MNNLQLATTLVAPTGTGKLFVPFEGGSHVSTFVESTGTNPAKLKFLRTLPKPVTGFAGVERSEVRLTLFENINSVLRPLTASINFSIPAEASQANRDALALNLALIARDALVLSDLAKYHRIPV